MLKLLLEKETFTLIGACIRVHKNLGNGFPAEVYHEALQKEFAFANIPIEFKKEVLVYYQGNKLNSKVKIDFLGYKKIVLSVVADPTLAKERQKQTLNLLKATNFEIGLLINFGEKKLTWKRFINT